MTRVVRAASVLLLLSILIATTASTGTAKNAAIVLTLAASIRNPLEPRLPILETARLISTTQAIAMRGMRNQTPALQKLSDVEDDVVDEVRRCDDL